MNVLSLRYKCRRCGVNIMFQRAPVTQEETKEKLDKWNCWLSNIILGFDSAFKSVSDHVCADGRGGVADIIGVEVTRKELTDHVMWDDELEFASIQDQSLTDPP